MDSKEELSKYKIADLQQELESRGLETSGKKTELVDRLWEDLQGKKGESNVEKKVDESNVLVAKLRIIKERESLAESEIEARANLEREQLRIKARSEQLDLELKLAEMGHVLSEPERDKVCLGRASTADVSCHAGEVLAAQVQRTLLPPAELAPFTGDVKDYHLFLKAFDAKIASKTHDSAELLYYLVQFTNGKPRQIARSCLSLGADGYSEARRLLDARYGSVHLLIESYVDRLRSWPRVHPGDVEGLDRLALFLLEVKNAMVNVPKGELEHPRTLREVVQKLPPSLRDRWMREADRMMEHGRDGSAFVGFEDLVKFLQREVRILKNPVFGVSSSRSSDGHGSQKVNAVTFSGARPSCSFCKGSHHLDLCDKLRFRPYSERKTFIQERRLCFGCLQPGHQARFCKSRLTCQVCGSRHASLLHRTADQGTAVRAVGAADSSAVAPGAETRPKVVSAGVGVQPVSGASATMMPILPVRLRGKGGREVLTNAFLDQGSSGSFVTSRLANRLDLDTEELVIKVDTVFCRGQEVRSSVAKGASISPLTSDESFCLPALFTLDSIPISCQDVCQSGDLERWQHLVDLPVHELNVPVELLIGSNLASLLAPREVRSPAEGTGPVGVRTSLGWYVIGPRHRGAYCDPHTLVNFLRLSEPRESAHADLTDMFHRIYEEEFRDVADDSERFSMADLEWMKEMTSSIHRDDEGHYEVALPKVELGEVPDSLPTASRRLESLRRRFKKDPEYFASYKAVIQSLAEDGYAVKVAGDDVEKRPVWYLPHHGVQEPRKGKLRVVFDCAARSYGLSLNDMLKAGPNLTNSLIGVLSRFREGPVAFTCDVEAMYHQVHVPDPDSDLLRFLWFHDDDIDGKVVVWKMRSHVFGAVSSSSVASLALRQCAEEGVGQFPKAAEVLVQNSYVDDVAVATTSVGEAVRLAHDLMALCKGGAFRLRKFASNSAAFLKEIDSEDRGKNVKHLDLDKDRMMSERTLGLKWDVESDSFGFEFKGGEKPVTRRGLLSTVSSIFDPLGMIAPVTLRGKALLQRLCVVSCRWDDPIPDELTSEWAEWLSQARQLNSVHLDRDITAPPGVVTETELHVFADASETAHAAVAYVRQEVETVSGEKKVSVHFVFGKSRLNPIRRVQSIPRLELCAAALAVRLKLLLVRELTVEFERVRLWTDSLIVLSCVRNRTTRFKTFVANRLSLIHSASEVSDWGYVPSKMNPADIGSRGARPDTLAPWLEGPRFLLQEKERWPEEPAASAEVPAVEVKVSAVLTAQGAELELLAAPAAGVEPEVPAPSGEVRVCAQACRVEQRLGAGDPSDSLVCHYSSFYRLTRAVAWLRRFADVIRSGEYRRFCLARRRGLRRREPECRKVLELSDVRAAEAAVLRYAQSSLAEHPGSGAPDGPVKVQRDSPLASLRPVMRNGLLVVGGRLGSSPSLSEISKHPVIVPRRHHVARLLLRQAHIAAGHQGRDHTVWKLRERYWVVGAGADVRHMIRSCVVCRKVKARPQQQLMADLPESRVTAGTKAFEKVGLDVFGPFAVKSGRGERKRFGLMCTCLVTRAVHIEVLHSMTADSLINAVRRISARRGAIRYVISDRGTNFVGADRELKEASRDVDYDELQRESVRRGIHWEFNPPTASHFNGVTERQIRTFRKIMRSMPQQRMTDETLETLFCEIESIINSRPLNYVSTCDGDVEPISPNHLLLLRGDVGSEPCDLPGGDSFCRRRWRQVQYLASQFWRRWLSEYAPTLQFRQKWRQVSKNLQIGDVVLVVDKDLPRGSWPLGRIVKVFASADGSVRKVLVRTSSSTYLRPIHKLVLVSSDTDLEW